MTFLQQLGTMQCSLCNQCIVVVHTEYLGIDKCADNEGDGLQLRARFGYRIFIDRESLYVEVICKIFEIAFVCNLSGEEE